MARVTVEDCVLKVPNRFELVLLTSQRARDISAGAPLTVERDNDKTTVVALREIAESTVDIDTLKTALVQGLQKAVDYDEPEEESSDAMAMELEQVSPTMGLDMSQEMREDSLSEQDETDFIVPDGGEPEE